ncbi:glycosyltransferase [Aquincola sp. S2]|uniref:Glycosyltransferase n=1 Tax=Pseudaquabacterium terrae TaxID=2732868 RepID=A0ABX2EKG5_9BURK|nr:glycosyltransferase [Aquabacterium terrae]NRF69123.1 glycosyltransferase [Aquabacterium terrae]
MTLTVVIPALNEERRIAEVVQAMRSQAPQVPVIVIDDGSTDRTVELARGAGARVVTSTMLGKGASMQDALELVQTPWVLFLDGDLTGLQSDLVQRMTAPLADDSADLVKARFGRSGGRVTELTAKPLLRAFFPELATYAQPLGGIVSGNVKLLRSLTLEDDYGVDVGLLIDAHLCGARITEVDIGELAHDSQPLDRLSLMAQQVGRAIMQRAKASSRFSFEQFLELEEMERQARGTFERLAERLADSDRIVLMSIDGPLSDHSFMHELARQTGREAELARAIERHGPDEAGQRQAVAQVFKFVHQRDFMRVARGLPLHGDAVEAIKRLRRAGWLVGVVSDSFFISTDIVRRRVFADFAMAHFTAFANQICNGHVRLNPAFVHGGHPQPQAVDKANVIRHLRDQVPASARIVMIGAGTHDLSMLELANLGLIVNGRSTQPGEERFIRVQSLSEASERLLDVGDPFSAG